MNGVYGGLICILMYGIGERVTERNFLLLNNSDFLLLNGQNLKLL